MELERISQILQEGAYAVSCSQRNPTLNIAHILQSETALPNDLSHTTKYPAAKIDPTWHGDSGPIIKSYQRHFVFGPLQDRVIDATGELGVPVNPDAVRCLIPLSGTLC